MNGNSNLEKLTHDLGIQLAFRLVGAITLGADLIWLVAFLGFSANRMPLPEKFVSIGWIGLVSFFLIAIVLLINRSKSKWIWAEIEELMGEAKRQTDLLNLIRPMVQSALSLEEAIIKPTLIGRLIDWAMQEIRTNESAVGLDFLASLPETVKELVRIRCREIIMTSQQDYSTSLEEVIRNNQTIDPVAVEEFGERVRLLNVILNHIPDPLSPKERRSVFLPSGHEASPHS